jgi:endoglucanase
MDNLTAHKASDHDQRVRKTIPFYDTIHAEVTRLVKLIKPGVRCCVDTGCGTGRLVEQALRSFPAAHFILADPSEAMLEQTRARLTNHDNIRLMILPSIGSAHPDHTKEHWIYLFLPEPMKSGKTYLVRTGSLASNGTEWTLAFDETKARSEAIHVNLLGHVSSASQKYGYVYRWLGDKGGLELRPYEESVFRVFDQATGKSVFSGKMAFRAPATQQETFHKSDSPPDGNFLKTEVYECDFSAFKRPGTYVLSVQGIGCSFPFSISADIYREAFRTMARGLYHNRSGIALEKPYTEFTRPAPHNPKLTPGFAGRLIYTTIRFTEWGSEGGDAKQLLAASKGPIESAGWYQDAGDWDSYYSHLRVAQELMLAYEMAPKNFTDGELNIPESGNGVPDNFDEAAWLPRFCYRLRHELMEKHYGTGGLGLRIAGDAFGDDEKILADGKRVGQGSWEDVNRNWAASGEDPWSTYRYAGAAAHLAFCLQIAHAKDPENIDWSREATEAYAWAQKNTHPGDEQKGPALREPRSYAAATLFRISADKAYERQSAADTADVKTDTILVDDRQYGPIVYALGGARAERDITINDRMRGAVLATADAIVGVASKRALRWGGDWHMPMLVGQQTTPPVLQAVAGYALAKEKEPERAERYLTALYTTGDYFLGCNALNMTWVTGLGPRHPRQVFHMDAWYNSKAEFHPGIIPYGPWRKERAEGQGPWDVAWPH